MFSYYTIKSEQTKVKRKFFGRAASQPGCSPAPRHKKIPSKLLQSSSDTFTFPTTKSIYDEVELNVGYLGVSLEVTLPEGYAKKADMGYVLRENLTKYCKITKVMASDKTYY